MRRERVASLATGPDRHMESNTINLFRAKLREIERIVWLQNRHEALCSGITLPQCHAIVEIGAAGELNLKGLSERLGLDNSTLSRTVESLVKSGLAERIRSNEDRRATLISLNAKGRALCERINSTWNRICEEMFRDMPREKRKHVVECVSILADVLTGCSSSGGDLNPKPLHR